MEKIVKIEPMMGNHSGYLRMLLKGELGVVQFVLDTGFGNKTKMKQFMPLAVDVGYHSYKKMYENQGIVHNSCPYLEGMPCYYDGSSIHGCEVYEILLEKGSDGVWDYLESYYINTFGELR
jgi:hypothetical protein